MNRKLMQKNGGGMVCLISPPILTKAFVMTTLRVPPIGIAYLAGTLQANDIETQIIDGCGEALDQFLPLDFTNGYSVGLRIDDIVDRIDKRSDIIGVSCLFSAFWPHDERLINKIRKRFPDARIVLGGEHTTAVADYILKAYSAVDICVKGEGEETFFELVKTIRHNGDISAVSGVVYKKDGVIQHTSPRKRITDINQIPLPAWDLVPLENYMERTLGHGMVNARSMPLLATRGCPYQCTFCSSPQMWTTRWIARNHILVVDEMQLHIEKYGAENFDFYDLTAIIKKEWILEFANEVIRRGLNVTYQLPSGTRSEAIDAETADALYRSGCRQLNYAPESGSVQTLKKVKKKVKLPNLEKSLQAVCKRGLKVMAHIILFPDDTWKDVFQTFKFMLRCSWLGLHDVVLIPFTPYPGTELYDQLIKEGRVPPLSRKYFISLLTQADLASAESYNPRFSPRQVIILRFLFMGMFYVSTYVFRPQRIFVNFKNIFLNTPETRGEKILRTFVIKLKKLYFGTCPEKDLKSHVSFREITS